MNLLPRLPASTFSTVLAGAVAIMVVHTGPLVRPELIAWEHNMTKLNGSRTNTAQANETGAEATHPYAGMWVTADGHIRHELLPNGRYDEQRGARKSAYRGRYVIVGNHIDYVDDTGFTADGDFVDGVLYHGGMIFYREQ